MADESVEQVVERIGQQYLDDRDVETAFNRALRAAFLSGQQNGQQAERERCANWLNERSIRAYEEGHTWESEALLDAAEELVPRKKA